MATISKGEASPPEQRNSAKRDADGNPKADEPSTTTTARPTKTARVSDANSEIVRLNVGGVRYEASRDTLMRYEDSMLASLISGKWKEGDGEEGEIFIDRDGSRFKYILDYLRSDRVVIPDLSIQLALKSEFEYFGIDADLSKVTVMDDFTTINVLAKKIKRYEANIAEKRKKIAAIKESYRLAGLFYSSADAEGKILELNTDKDVDPDMLTTHLLARGLHVASYVSCVRALTVNVCVISMKEQLAPGT